MRRHVPHALPLENSALYLPIKMQEPSPFFVADDAPAEEKDEQPHDTPSLAMISLPIASDTATLLALAGEGNETAAQLHITLLFLGDWHDYAPDIQQAVMDAVKKVAQEQKPLGGEIQGFGCFTPAGSVKKAFYLLPHMHGLHALHCALKEALPIPAMKEHDGFIPHITLAYLPMEASLPFVTVAPTPLTCAFLQLVVDDHILVHVSLAGE